MARKIQVFSFLESAVSDDTMRPFLIAPYWDHEAGAVVSTDGRRMHIWQLDKTANDYKKEAEKWGLPVDRSMYLHAVHDIGKFVEGKMDTQFPAWKRVVPDYLPKASNWKGEAHLHPSVMFTNPTKKTRGQAIGEFGYFSKSGPVNIDYLIDLEGWSWIYAKDNELPEKRAIAFTAVGNMVPGPGASSLHAVIMPMNLDCSAYKQE